MTSTSSTYTIPVGPLHVALEEPMYFRLDVQGETVRHLEINAGHVHRGIEYLATKRSLFQNIVLTERICSLCSNSHPEAFAMAAEQIAGIEVPERGAYLRVIAGEVKRIASNLFNVAILAHLVGYEALFMHIMQVREIAQEIKEAVFGNRMDLGAMCIGGVRYDLDIETTAMLILGLDKLAAEIVGIEDAYRSNGSILRRTRDVGVLSHEEGLACGVVGPVARATGIDYDVRQIAPYHVYDRLPLEVRTRTEGDVWARAMIRLHEARNAIELIRACLHQLPDGPVNVGERPDIPPGRGVAKCEAPRGELIYYLKTNSTPNPERLKWRVPSFMNWDALKFMMRDAKVADIAIIVNSIDPCVSCTER
ncbi:Carbon monoxide-induced hydrogenase [Rhodovastum atsumiense]|uniref:Carbon monoxide-induced hydrogenase n=1 Tax=Rhodovastum atsumiense TaxID=504468 RepID=A0A5M6IXV9_9PROT|nr:nickel-dependent hydrogenase large subunit [Rhodovastum atsumiense]KAA5612195.1 carbon monoxide-induced hydrogenase [Rhodovastum atsumiense]CAH2603848.1 Carbon monoxide-induced hydrogenase [Rhodovastum atsumiense]